MAPRVAMPLLMIAAPHRGRTSEPQFPNRRHKRNHSGYPNLGVSGTPTSSARSRALSRSLARSALLVEVTLRKSPPRLSSVVAVVQQVEFVCWIRDSAGLDNQMTGSRRGPHMNTSNRKMCCRGRDNNTNQGFGGKKESRNKKQTRRRQVLAGFVDHTRKRTRRPSGYQPGISIKRRVEYSNPKCSQFCACGSSSLLSMFFSEEDGLGGVGGLYGHSSWALAHIMRWVPQAQRQPNTMCSAQPSLGKGCGESRKLCRTKEAGS